MGGSPLTLMRLEQLTHYHAHSQVASKARLQARGDISLQCWALETQVSPCYSTLLEMYMAAFEGRVASALNYWELLSILQAQGLRMHPEQNDQKEKSRSRRFFFKVTVDVNVLHFPSKVCSSDQA